MALVYGIAALVSIATVFFSFLNFSDSLDDAIQLASVHRAVGWGKVGRLGLHLSLLAIGTATLFWSVHSLT